MTASWTWKKSLFIERWDGWHGEGFDLAHGGEVFPGDDDKWYGRSSRSVVTLGPFDDREAAQAAVEDRF